MDSYKRPYRGSKIYVRKKGKEDDTLVKLYKQSEFTKEDIEEISGELIGNAVIEELENLRKNDAEYGQRISSLEQSVNNAQVVGDNLIIGI